ncbi:MAG TPA: alpha-amylase family glycosyl hydrolase [Candidatus Binataceae bacterium]|nr:alpha-amylase family glycosyl hydrolase [Candidatus Binataceae bacterium]
MPSEWWRGAVFYEIYARSFADSNADGIGDLDGITAHLDYLNDGTDRSLGIDAIWLTPINPSPLKDWGYDVSDYCAIHPELGGLGAFERLSREAARRGIRIILDLVPNHTSDQHRWFRQSRSARSNPKRNWYIWKAGTPDRTPNNWVSIFDGPAWKWDEATREWYLHLFLSAQPDLNFRNPEVVAAMHEVIRFWLDRGAAGYRVDVIHGLIKDAMFRDNPALDKVERGSQNDVTFKQKHLYDFDQPDVHEIIRGFRRVIDEYGDRIMVGEVWPHSNQSLALYLRPDELQQAFNFRFLFCPWEAARFRAQVEEIERILPADSWPTWTLSNHDFARHITRYAHGTSTAARARLAAVMLLALRGTPFLYYGEEIGMPNVSIARERWRDPVGRDGCRTPMQWSDAPGGGFTNSKTPWLPLGDCAAVNVARQMDDPGSMLSLYRRAIRVRSASPALRAGTIRVVEQAPQDCLAFVREVPASRAMVALNFTDEPREIEVPSGRILLSSDPGRDPGKTTLGKFRLAPNEATVIEC